MGWDKFRRKFNVAGNLTIGGDVGFTRTAANILSLISGDTLDLSGTAQRLRVPNATGTPTLANNGELVVVANPTYLLGTARIYWRSNGTTYYVACSGTV